MSISNAALRNQVDDYSCDERTSIFSDRKFYISLERFCNQVTATQPEFEPFLQYYFNDEGYVDIWRIPHAMMDVLLHRTQYNRVFESGEFRKTFHRFVREFLIFCSKECHREALLGTTIDSASNEGLSQQRGIHEYLNTLMASFSEVLEKLESEDR